MRLTCHLDTVGQLTKSGQVDSKEKKKLLATRLLEVECVHCQLTVHWGCIEKGWEFSSMHETHHKKAKKTGELRPRCPGCKLKPKTDHLIASRPPVIKDCCAYCLQSVRKPEPLPGLVQDPQVQRIRKNLLLLTGDKLQPYMHNLCRDVKTYAYSSHCFVACRQGKKKKNWRCCSGEDCAEPYKENSNLIKCAEMECK